MALLCSLTYLNINSGEYFVSLKTIKYNQVAYIYSLISYPISIPAEDSIKTRALALDGARICQDEAIWELRPSG